MRIQSKLAKWSKQSVAGFILELEPPPPPSLWYGPQIELMVVVWARGELGPSNLAMPSEQIVLLPLFLSLSLPLVCSLACSLASTGHGGGGPFVIVVLAKSTQSDNVTQVILGHISGERLSLWLL